MHKNKNKDYQYQVNNQIIVKNHKQDRDFIFGVLENKTRTNHDTINTATNKIRFIGKSCIH